MRIGEVARSTEVSVRAIRHYDTLGLLASTRGANRYRIFTPEDVQRVHLIRLFLGVGFRLEEIRAYAPCWQGTASALAPVSAPDAAMFYERKLTQIDEQLASLQTLRARLHDNLADLKAAAKAALPTP